MSIWQRCAGEKAMQTISGTVYRLVESQEQIATTAYVDTLAEQAVLEQLLERSKPPQPPYSHSLHYLLATPFRYPPLKRGSRFGQKHQPGLFYGATDVPTTLAESSFYRLVYLESMSSEAMPSKPLSGQHTLFDVGYRTECGVRLQEPPFDHYKDAIRHPSDYRTAQRLGTDMRAAGVLCFEYPAARWADGINVALYNGSAFSANRPTNQQRFISATGQRQVEFKNIDTGQVYSYDTSRFRVDGLLPRPA